MTTGDVIEREAVRAVVLTPEREVLLLRVRPPDGGERFWITPGGGMDPGETHFACLQRELREEIGLVDFRVGPLVWLRDTTFTWAGRRIHQRERLHVVEAAKFTPVIADPVEARTIECFRWWSVAELAATQERLTPLALAGIVGKYLDEGAPREPLEVEVLVY